MNGAEPTAPSEFLLCVENGDYPESLEVGKLYPVLADTDAARHELVRVIDESGEDYLYPRRYFVEIDLPTEARKALRRAS
ncbi:MAG TPA: hypothetical protein VFX98_09465 [Longimicrobiaceae bacterium]|nr:hypothetical protein [Longimicrobiaceae bacterium]